MALFISQNEERGRNSVQKHSFKVCVRVCAFALDHSQIKWCGPVLAGFVKGLKLRVLTTHDLQNCTMTFHFAPLSVVRMRTFPPSQLGHKRKKSGRKGRKSATIEDIFCHLNLLRCGKEILMLR